MKKAIGLMAAMMMAAAAGHGRIFDTGGYGKPVGQRMSKESVHKLYGENMDEHEFTINGEKIMARNRKTAMKIYANRHPESKKRKK